MCSRECSSNICIVVQLRQTVCVCVCVCVCARARAQSVRVGSDVGLDREAGRSGSDGHVKQDQVSHALRRHR